MPLVYSPIDGSVLDWVVKPRPRSAFLMLHANNRVSEVEATMQAIIRQAMVDANFDAITATDIARSDDYLLKIIRLIQGCGFRIAIFSDATPARTLANIFFEVGYCLALGKPAQLVIAGDSAAPSDFVRSEWIKYEGDDILFKARVAAFLASMNEYGNFLHSLALSAEDAEEPDPELAFERFKRAFLISGNDRDIDGIKRVQKKLRGLTDAAAIGTVMRSNRRSLSDTVSEFLRLAEHGA